MREGGERDVVSKEETTLVVNDGELVVAGMCSRAVEIIEDTKSASEGGCSDGIIIKVNITGNGLCGDCEAGVCPGGVGEGGDSRR